MEHPEQKAIEEAGWFDWTYKGVDHTLPGNGGIECRDFLSLSQRYWESAIASLVALVALIVAVPKLKLPRMSAFVAQKRDPCGKRVLLLLMCLTFGIELGFKLATRQMIWIGNPCHVATMVQIFILAAPPSRIVTAAFRLHMHMLTGAPIAILFPVINTRLLPFETGVYFVQHILMLVIPFYLIKTGDPFIPEDLMDFNWALASFGFLFIYHFLPLQFLAYHSQVNLNNMLCPAVSDPFNGKYYRLVAIVHQFILILIQGKVLVLLARGLGLVPRNTPSDLCYLADKLVRSESTEYCCLSPNTCSSNMSNVSIASSTTKQLDDSGFLGAGCVLAGKQANADSHSCSEDERLGDSFVEQEAPDAEDQPPPHVFQRLVNGCIPSEMVGLSGGEGNACRSLDCEITGWNDKVIVNSDGQKSRNGHAKVH